MKDIQLRVTDTSDNFSTWISKDFVPEEIRSELARCQVLIVPEIGFRDYDKPLFPVGTESLLATLKRSLGSSVQVDICISDANYAELALHSDTCRLGCFVVLSVVLPLFLNVIANVIYEKMKANPERTDISFNMTVVDTNGVSKNISYEGPAKGFNTAAKHIISLWKTQ
jgi:hypothetical protein